jgi:hypothetical protein
MMNMPDAKLEKNPVRMTEAQVCAQLTYRLDESASFNTAAISPPHVLYRTSA